MFEVGEDRRQAEDVIEVGEGVKRIGGCTKTENLFDVLLFKEEFEVGFVIVGCGLGGW